MTEANKLREHINGFKDGDIDQEDFVYDVEDLLEAVDDSYSEMETKVTEAEYHLANERSYHKLTEDKLTEANSLLSDSIVATTLYEVQMLEILMRMYEKLNLPKLQKLEQELGTQPKWAPKLAS